MDGQPARPFRRFGPHRARCSSIRLDRLNADLYKPRLNVGFDLDHIGSGLFDLQHDQSGPDDLRPDRCADDDHVVPWGDDHHHGLRFVLELDIHDLDVHGLHLYDLDDDAGRRGSRCSSRDPLASPQGGCATHAADHCGGPRGGC